MKRRITVEQLMELTEEQKQRLREWWNPEEGDYVQHNKYGVETICLPGPFDEECPNVYFTTDYRIHAFKEECLPLLDIGQMIELLEEKKMVTESLDIKAPKGLINTYSVWYGNGDFPKKYESKELCDALWQAVKQVL